MDFLKLFQAESKKTKQKTLLILKEGFSFVLSAFNSLTPHKRIKIPRPDFHACRTAHRLLAKFKVDLIHRLIKPDLLLIILKEIDLVTARAKLT